MLPRMRAGWCSSTMVLALTFPLISPWTMMVPQVISAASLAPSPTTRTSLVTMVPVNLPSMRTVPSKVSLPSNSEPRPSRALRSLPAAAAGTADKSSRFSMAMSFGLHQVRRAVAPVRSGVLASPSANQSLPRRRRGLLAQGAGATGLAQAPMRARMPSSSSSEV